VGLTALAGAARASDRKAAFLRRFRPDSSPKCVEDTQIPMKRRLKAAGLPGQFSPHSFRVATVTDLLEQNVPLEDVQHPAGHADPRTTRLDDRRRRKVTRNIVERISIWAANRHSCGSRSSRP